MRCEPFAFMINNLAVYTQLKISRPQDGQTSLIYIGLHTEGGKKGNLTFTQQLPYEQFCIPVVQLVSPLLFNLQGILFQLITLAGCTFHLNPLLLL